MIALSGILPLSIPNALGARHTDANRKNVRIIVKHGDRFITTILRVMHHSHDKLHGDPVHEESQ